MPLSITCGGTGAWINVSHVWQAHLRPDVALHGELTRDVIQLLADVFSYALELAAAAALGVFGLVSPALQASEPNDL